MKKDSIKLCCLVLVISLILSGVVFFVSDLYKKEKQKKIDEENLIVDEILDIYESFKSKIEQYGEERDIINQKIGDYISYYTGMEENYEEMKEVVSSYETLVREVEDSASYLKANCLNKIYGNGDANMDCNSYMINFEKTVNVFLIDIQFLNSKIDEYNNWATLENEGLSDDEKHSMLEKFVPTKYKDFVDINGDGTYLGMNID